MKITLKDSEGNVFTNVTTWENADVAAKAIFKQKRYSDLYYELMIDELKNIGANGSIDLEPASFHQPHQKNIFTWHLNTFWGNISNLKAPKFGLTQDDINECKVLLTYLPK